ncbi:hypothetical protein AALO_G00087860 [Alosa alosa]|uniref:Histone-lysine N-methyltransferase PRDM9-like n=1 Tax=Alosa alosa TaxID=278164 RepID=A0AAV6GZ87_9TELE|nr:histone-lysine N-methyltransferase PRDM9 [Alosa alosa]KAG5280330.1 hypothetical protein AALO_G00087860 [Alosa alosa]
MSTSSGEISAEKTQEDVSASTAVEKSPEDDDEPYDDDNYYCEKCQCCFWSQCEVHGPPVFALDFPCSVGTPQRALLTLPAGLVVGRSRVKESSLGIFNQGQVVPVGMHFGPYSGETTSEEEALKSVYSWVIVRGKKHYEFIDATRDTHSNWMRYVMCSRSNREQNLVAFQQGGRVLFRCCAPIRPGEELLVWYAEEYARGLGLTWDQLWHHKRSSTYTNTDNGSSLTLPCPYCQFSFPAKSYLQTHVRRSHAEQYQNFLETHPVESEFEEVDPRLDLDICLLGSDVPPSSQMEPTTGTGQQGSESLIGRAPCQSETSDQSQPSNGLRCWKRMSDSDWSKDTSSASMSINDKGHSCPRCGRTFARAYHLKRHVNSVHDPDKLYWYRKRKSSNPRKHLPNPETETEEEDDEEEEAEERAGADGDEVRAPMEVYPCARCFIAFMSLQSLQEHMELQHAQGQGQRSDATEEPGDPSDPPYEPPVRKHNTRRGAVQAPAQKRGRGRPRTRTLGPTRPTQPKQKRPQKVQQGDGDSEPPPGAQTFICSQCGEACGDGVTATSHGCRAQTPAAPPLPQHGTQHGTDTQLTCGECQGMFADAASLRSHGCVQVGEGPYSCAQCSLRFSQPSNLRRHQRSVHAMVKPYCCGPCGKFYTQASGLRRHQEGRQHKGRRTACAKANANANASANASTAVTPIITTAATIYSCSYCQFSFTAQRYLHKHVKRHHPAEFIQAQEGSEGEGGEVGYGLGDAEELARISQSCPQCEKTFFSVKGFKSHHCFRRGKRACPCHVCGKRFSNVYSLRQHERTHTGERPYACPHCPKSFAVYGQLNVHLRTHTGERPYLCAQCGEGFRQSGDLKRHEQKHLGVRPHACPQCPKSFSRPQSLRAHLQIHSGMRLFHCTQCSKAFTRKYHLTRHLHKMHSS